MVVLWEFAFWSAHLFECSLCEQVTLDSAECLMRVVISLFYQSQFFSLGLVQTTLYTTIYIVTDDSEISKEIILKSRLDSVPWMLQSISFFLGGGGLYNVMWRKTNAMRLTHCKSETTNPSNNYPCGLIYHLTCQSASMSKSNKMFENSNNQTWPTVRTILLAWFHHQVFLIKKFSSNSSALLQKPVGLQLKMTPMNLHGIQLWWHKPVGFLESLQR